MSRRSTEPAWRPWGAARRAVEAPSPAQAAEEAFFEAVLAAAGERYDLGPEHVALAWTLTTWQPGLTAAEARALFLVTLVSLVDQAQGSTRTRVLGPEGRAHLEQVLAELLPGEGAQAAAEAQAIGELLGAQQARLPVVLAAVAAPPAEPPPQPLVLEGAYLYPQALLLAE
ncbi:MAG: hypothetical protein KDD82_03580, partial [Planctomycetes bacterium]|nr:hypothetical protein [Planctomycetota bacterium]